ncbi:unnamed protein product [Ectocarpus sp. CCAP 1310/34]|nr:unnamed protein product [Ectocarpus sp. CCAP 1310/34]
MSEEEGLTEQQRQLHAQAAAWLHERNVIELITQFEEAEEEMGRLGDDDEAAYALAKQMGALTQQAETGLQEMLAIAHSAPESPGERASRHTQLVSVNKLRRFLPTIGKGMSEANDAASNRRRQMVHANGVYHYLCTRPWHGSICSFRQYTGFDKEEFDQFYAELGGDGG